MTSSRVAMPRVRPSASATTATWTRACCMARSASSSEVRLPEHEHPPHPAERAAGGGGPGPDRVSRSLAWTKPRTSSTSSPATSRRVWPDDDHEGLGLGRRGRAGQPDDAVARHHHRGDAAVAEVERTGEELVGDLLDQPLVARRAEHHGELVGRRGGGQLVTGLDAEEPHARRSTAR